MEYKDGRLRLRPVELDLLFGRGGFRPPALEGEPVVDWEGLKPKLNEINNSRMYGNAVVTCIPQEVSLGKQGPEVALALLVLARRALAKETIGQARAGALAICESVVDGLHDVVASGVIVTDYAVQRNSSEG